MEAETNAEPEVGSVGGGSGAAVAVPATVGAGCPSGG